MSDGASGIRTKHQMEQDIHELYFKLNGSTHFAKLTQCIMCLKFYTDFKLVISVVTTSSDSRWCPTQIHIKTAFFLSSYWCLHYCCVVNLDSFEET